MRIAVVCTTYRRPDYTARLADALKDCPYDVFVSQDWHEKEGPAVKAALPPTWINAPRLGIDENKIFAINQVASVYDGVIFLEDDTIPYGDWATWFATQLHLRADNPDFLAACGYAREEASSAEEYCNLYADRLWETRHARFNPWGWAMLSSRWQALYANNAHQYRLDVGHEVNGRFDWWLFNKEDMFCVHPVVARVQSIGWDRAEHTPSREFHENNEYNKWGVWTLAGITPTYG